MEAIAEDVAELRSQLAAVHRDVSRLMTIMLARAEGAIAGRADLDSGGDLVVAFDAKSWKGESCKGKRMSECPSDFLDHLARAFQAMGDKDRAANTLYKGKPSAPYQYRKAALCRGWALRLRLGWKPPAPKAEAAPGSSFDDAAAADRFAATPPATSTPAAQAPPDRFAAGPSAFDNDAAEPEPPPDSGAGPGSTGSPPTDDDDELPP